jgi:hypothetical protein
LAELCDSKSAPFVRLSRREKISGKAFYQFIHLFNLRGRASFFGRQPVMLKHQLQRIQVTLFLFLKPFGSIGNDEGGR